jgi:hypothetical protein
VIDLCARAERVLAVVLLAAVIGPGTGVLCISSDGHCAVENPFSNCCGAASAGTPGGSLFFASADCGDCTDIPILRATLDGVAPVALMPLLPVFSTSPTSENPDFGTSEAFALRPLPLRC